MGKCSQRNAFVFSVLQISLNGAILRDFVFNFFFGDFGFWILVLLQGEEAAEI